MFGSILIANTISAPSCRYGVLTAFVWVRLKEPPRMHRGQISMSVVIVTWRTNDPYELDLTAGGTRRSLWPWRVKEVVSLPLWMLKMADMSGC